MTVVRVLVEGETEESFVNNVLGPHLLQHSVQLWPILLRGRTRYERVKREVERLLKQHQSGYCSTMLDLYRLGKGYPGTPLPPNLPSAEKAIRIERDFREDICNSLHDRFRPAQRFLPYIQLHEFEALLFSAPKVFAEAIHRPTLASAFEKIRKKYPSPEDIDDSPEEAPSKRVLKLHTGYDKVLNGSQAAEKIGLAAMRTECSHFAGWLGQLEALGHD